ncbi:MAG: metalloregulator ArsR/SmtB family transcription factor [Anaerolineae bacterium]|nr:metalloregulator ArsR/SmtB family transcription factor [Anaerolineae bacterium]
MRRDYQLISQVFKALAHPVRLEIVDLLRQGEVCVCHIETALGRRQAYVSQQLTVLRDAGLVDSRKEGLQVYYRLTDERAALLLEVLYGPSEHARREKLEGCPCPACATIMLSEIQGA